MKFIGSDGDIREFNKLYKPLLLRQGFSTRMFPTLGIYIDTKYPGWTNHANENKEHTNLVQKAIFTRIRNQEEYEAAPLPGLTYERFASALESNIFHELGHWIHMTRFGENGSPIWQEACRLMGKPMSFGSVTDGTGYQYRQSWEDFANHFDRCIKGWITDEPFMDFVRGLYGIKYKVYTDKDYVIVNDRAYVPMRRIIEDFQDQTLRDIEWLYDTREVVVISAESGFEE